MFCNPLLHAVQETEERENKYFQGSLTFWFGRLVMKRKINSLGIVILLVGRFVGQQTLPLGFASLLLPSGDFARDSKIAMINEGIKTKFSLEKKGKK